jgi:acyl-CoA reductase-like NAD-dependent aldehyde dehydrogenase
MFTDATQEEINKVMEQSWNAFLQYRKMPLKKRSEFMKAIAE